MWQHNIENKTILLLVLVRLFRSNWYNIYLYTWRETLTFTSITNMVLPLFFYLSRFNSKIGVDIEPARLGSTELELAR
jgi:hypothetical protein